MNFLKKITIFMFLGLLLAQVPVAQAMEQSWWSSLVPAKVALGITVGAGLVTGLWYVTKPYEIPLPAFKDIMMNMAILIYRKR